MLDNVEGADYIEFFPERKIKGVKLKEMGTALKTLFGKNKALGEDIGTRDRHPGVALS